MTFVEIMSIVTDTSKTDYQKSADIHALLSTLDSHTIAPKSSHTAVMKVRKPRGPNKPKLPPAASTIDFGN